jgi:hypothetical protein
VSGDRLHWQCFLFAALAEKIAQLRIPGALEGAVGPIPPGSSCRLPHAVLKSNFVQLVPMVAGRLLALFTGAPVEMMPEWKTLADLVIQPPGRVVQVKFEWVLP